MLLNASSLSADIARAGGHYAVQGHSRSPICANRKPAACMPFC